MSEIGNKLLSAAAPAVGLVVCLASTAVFSESLGAKLGKIEYRTQCSVCHGDNGKGDGPMSNQLTKEPANLQLISENNNGVFPFDNVYALIDGRETVRAHGTSDMPIWGDAYVPDVETIVGGNAVNEQIEAAIAGRVLSLVYYIRSIQTQ